MTARLSRGSVCNTPVSGPSSERRPGQAPWPAPLRPSRVRFVYHRVGFLERNATGCDRASASQHHHHGTPYGIHRFALLYQAMDSSRKSPQAARGQSCLHQSGFNEVQPRAAANDAGIAAGDREPGSRVVGRCYQRSRARDRERASEVERRPIGGLSSDKPKDFRRGRRYLQGRVLGRCRTWQTQADVLVIVARPRRLVRGGHGRVR